jgi:prepilin-type N-terminal cleavage/methylation domain-containing protein
MTQIIHTRRAGGFTLVELLIAVSIYSVIFGALAAGAVALMRAYNATEKYSKATGDQVRILDYIARDLRLASSVTVSQNSSKLTLTLPDQYAQVAPSRVLRVPAVSMTAVTYGSTPVTVAYYISGPNCVREENGVAMAIATDVPDFQLTFDNSDPSGKVVATTVSFSPKYQMKESATARAATVRTNRTTLRK